MAVITAGNAAIDRASSFTSGYTLLMAENACTGTGILDTIEVWAATNIAGFKVGTFWMVVTSIYRCRDFESIGAVAAGSKQTFAVSLNAVTGDYIGCYYSSGTLERADTGGGCKYYNADMCYLNATVSINSGSRLVSLYASGVDSGFSDYEIKIGQTPYDLSGASPSVYTWISLQSPCPSPANITEVLVQCVNALSGFKIGIFDYLLGTIAGYSSFVCKAAETVIGTLAAGTLHSITVDWDIDTGDYIGYYSTYGDVKRDNTIGSGAHFIGSDVVASGAIATYEFAAGRFIGLQGLGWLAEAPPPVTGTRLRWNQVIFIN